MTTPISRARAKLRAVYRFQHAARLREEDDDAENGQATPLLRPPELERDNSSPRRERSTDGRTVNRWGMVPGVGLATQKSPMAHADSGLSQQGQPQETPDADNPSSGSPGYFAPMSDLKALSGLVFTSYLNILMLAIPFAFAAEYLKWGALWRFGLSFLTLVPLALLLGEVTEDLAIRFGDVIGGLLNATFGNIVELILSLAALQKGLYDVVSMSLIGSVLSNLLLVLGCCFLVGGTQYHQQSFNQGINKAMCSLLFLSCIAFALPTAGQVLYSRDTLSTASLQNISHGTAIMLVIVYCFYLFFTLKTHSDETPGSGGEGQGGGGEQTEGGGDSEGPEKPSLSLSGAIGMLTGITVIVAFASEFLTGSIEEVSKQASISRPFLGLIVLPIAGNACEHITAVFVAAKDKMDLAIGVALGSSIQIAIFVLPTVVLVGWATGHHFSLALDPLSVLMLTLAVIHADFVSNDGSSNWLLGLQLVITYVLIGILFFFKSSA